MNERRITKRSSGERKKGRTDWERIRRLTDAEAAEAAAADENNPLWTREELKSAQLTLPSSPKSS